MLCAVKDRYGAAGLTEMVRFHFSSRAQQEIFQRSLDAVLRSAQ
jgi:hypothetical protein